MHTHTLIFLHGREDFGHDLATSFFDSKSSTGQSMASLFPNTRFVFPTSKMRYSARHDFKFSTSSFAEMFKGEEIISQWFDIWDIKKPEERQELMTEGMKESVLEIIGVVREEAKLVPMENIVLGGISQGFAVAVLAMMTAGLEVGGLMGLCGFLPFQGVIEGWAENVKGDRNAILKKISDMLGIDEQKIFEASTGTDSDLGKGLANLSIATLRFKTPIFLAHAKDDEIVPFAPQGEGLRRTVEKLGFNVTWKEYENGGHWIQPEHGVDDMAEFIRRAWKL